MTRQEFKNACLIAFDESIDLMEESISQFNGYGLPTFGSIVCTTKQLARLIRWQCQYMSGGFDMVELNELQRIGRHRFTIID
jgi:hypothetical protein